MISFSSPAEGSREEGGHNYFGDMEGRFNRGMRHFVGGGDEEYQEPRDDYDRSGEAKIQLCRRYVRTRFRNTCQPYYKY